jgi:Putative translation initiation inhibitor, yjgF family
MFLAVFFLASALTADQAPLTHSNPAKLNKPNGYSHVVTAAPGQTLYISGQVALDESGKVMGAGDMQAQAKQVFENLRIALNGAGADFSNVVKLNYYITDVSQVQKVRDVRNQYILSDFPASTLVEVKALVRPEFMIEVDAIAVIPAKPVPATSH